MQVPQFVVYTQSATPGYWSPEVINYNGSPYILSGATPEDIIEVINQENEIDELPEFRVVNTYYSQLYQLIDGQLVEIPENPAPNSPDAYYLEFSPTPELQ